MALIFALGMGDLWLRRMAHRQRRSENVDPNKPLSLAAVSSAASEPMQRWQTQLAKVVQRTGVMLSNALGLGVAATWHFVLEAVFSFRAYAAWAIDAGNSGARACGHHASLFGDLPDPMALSVMYGYVLISLCALANLKLVDRRSRNAYEITSQAANVLQSAARGQIARWVDSFHLLTFSFRTYLPSRYLRPDLDPDHLADIRYSRYVRSSTTCLKRAPEISGSARFLARRRLRWSLRRPRKPPSMQCTRARSPARCSVL